MLGCADGKLEARPRHIGHHDSTRVASTQQVHGALLCSLFSRVVAALSNFAKEREQKERGRGLEIGEGEQPAERAGEDGVG